MAQFPAVIELSSLNGATGFEMDGPAGSYSGFAVASADINGDGFGDLIIGAYGTALHGSSGTTYVVFGKASGFGTNVTLSSLDGTNGFQLIGGTLGDFSGVSVSGAGDVNGDGLADLTIGVPGADPHGQSSGGSYVVFGTASGFGAFLILPNLDGTNGFQLNGEAASDLAGRSVSSAGDVNGDGFADLIVGALGADPHGQYSGASYIVFGKASGFNAGLDLSSLNGTTGFKIGGEQASDTSGYSVSSAGDVNGDGFADVIIGAPGAKGYAGTSYVVFGKASGFANIDLSSLNGATGLKINGEVANDLSGISVSSAGDVNGDGFADLIIGAVNADPNGDSSGAAYVVFGKATGFGATLELSTLNGTNGFQISGAAFNDFTGGSVSSAGDVNGDGFADLVIGAVGAEPHGELSGVSYVVFGKATGFGANVDLSSLDGTNGFQLNGEAAGDLSGRSVSSAGDVNRDGFADLIIGASGVNAYSGASYVVFGRAPDTAVNLTGTNAGQTLAGGALNDTLSGLLGNDVLFGHAGNDQLDGGSGDDFLEGDTGSDNLVGGTGTDTASYWSSTGSVYARLDTGLGYSGDGAGDTLSGIENLLGGSGNDIFVGTNGNNSLTGRGGNDQLEGAGGDDVLQGGAGADSLMGGTGTDTASYAGSPGSVYARLDTGLGYSGDAANDTFSSIESLLGGNGDDILIGDGVANVIAGGRGNDFLEAGAGADTQFGGTGVDTASYAGSGAVYARLDTGLGYAGDAAGDTFSSIENLLGGSGDDIFVGDAGNNTLTGGGGNNQLEGAGGDDFLVGGAGADILMGGAGTDTASYAAAITAVTVRLGTGLGYTGDAAGDTLSNIENLIGGAGNDTLTGNAFANLLDGRAGDDFLEGGAGADTLIGGDGTDTVSYASSTASVYARLDTGLGYAGDAANDTLAGFENLISGAGNDTLVGNAFVNLLVGGPGADILDGGDNGFHDTVSYASSASSVYVRLDVGRGYTGDAAGDTLLRIGNLIGSAGDDILVGNSSVLEGGAGRDELDGGVGSTDTASYATSSGAVYARLDTGRGYSGDAEGDTFFSIENLTGSAGNDTLVGNSLANVMQGGAGDDYLEGGNGTDRYMGGAGIDTASYAPASGALYARLDTGTGYSGDANNELYTDIENLIGGSGNDVLVGNAVANRLTGGAGNDSLEGGGGDDVLEGGAGADKLIGGSGTDTASYAGSVASVYARLDTGLGYTNDAAGDALSGMENLIGGSGDDIFVGDGGSNTLTGGAGNDQLEGAGGDDLIVGGRGDDFLRGDAGDDLFVFTVGDGTDQIVDFFAGGTDDKVQLSGFSDATNFASLMTHGTDFGTYTQFDFASGDHLRLDNVPLASLTAGDFVFV